MSAGGARDGETRREAQRRLQRCFEAAGLDEAALEARILTAAATGLDPARLLVTGAEPIGPEAGARLAGFAARRLAREPIGRIVGTREFWGLPFRLSPAVLEPRADTETLVEVVLARRRGRAGLSILDLGTGSGAILVALLRELPSGWGIGTDRAAEALATARANARVNGVADRARFVACDWSSALSGRFDVVVSNPPYIRTGVIPGLAPEVRGFDPLGALDGGPDGLDAYRAILAALPGLLAPGGLAALEIGFDQGAAVGGLARAAGLGEGVVLQDLGGNDRVVVLDGPERA